MADYNEEAEVYEFPEFDDETAADDSVPRTLQGFLDAGNLVDELDRPEEVSAKILDLDGEAEQSMEKWLKKYKRAVALAKLQPTTGGKEIDSKNFPFKGASLAMMPYVTEAMLDFAARATPDLVWANKIVEVKVYGEKTNEKEARAERVSEYQNYQLQEQIPNWRKNQDKAMFALANTGTFFKETYYDPGIDGQRSDLHYPDDLRFDHNYETFEEAPDRFRDKKYSRNEVIGFIRGPSKWKLSEDDLDDDEQAFEFLIAYTWIDLDNDGLTEPYVATIFKDNDQIVHLRPDYDEEGIETNEKGEVISVDRMNRFTQYQFLPDPEGGPMGMGWGILLGPMFESINTSVRQLIDGGTVQNTAANSGFYAASMVSGRGNAIESGPVEARIGQLTALQTRGDLRNNIVQFPAAGPSPVMMQLMEFQVESARKMVNVTAHTEVSPGEAAALYLARLTQAMKNPNSVIMRVHDTAKREQQIIAELNYKHFDDEKYNRVLDGDVEASMEADYNPEDCDIRMVTDPSQGSDVERAARAQATLEEAKTQPVPVLNLRECYIDWLKSINHPDIERIAPEPDPNAVDPTQQMILAQQAAQMELEKNEQRLREREVALKERKEARETASDGVNYRIQQEEGEAQVISEYVDSIAKLMKEGMSAQQAVATIDAVEAKYMSDEEIAAASTEELLRMANAEVPNVPGNAAPGGNVPGGNVNVKV